MFAAIRSNFAVLIIASMFWCLLDFAHAHVELDSPNGGETLVAGSVYSIEYNPELAHGDTIRYQLTYSTVSNQGPWLPIDLNIPMIPATNSDGTPHFYDWTVPSVATTTGYVRVFQDNPGNVLGENDYDDISAGPFNIVADVGLTGDYNGDGRVDAGDYVIWRDTLGSNDPRANGDDTGSSQGVIDAADYAAWKDNFGSSSASLQNVVTVPEPRVACWVAVAGWWLARRRRKGAPVPR